MLFRIPALDQPLHVLEPIQCNICKSSINTHKDARNCIHCKTMKQCSIALVNLKCNIQPMRIRKMATKAEDATNYMLLALSFLEKADSMGAETKHLQKGIEDAIETKAQINVNCKP